MDASDLLPMPDLEEGGSSDRIPLRAPLREEGDEGASIKSMMHAVARVLDADGIHVVGHRQDGEALTLLLSGQCESDFPLQRAVAELAADLSRRCSSGERLPSKKLQIDCGQLAGLAISLPECTFTVIGVFAPSNNDCHECLVRLAPIIDQFFRMWVAEKKASVRASGLTAAINHCDIATLLVDRGSQILFANTAAEGLLAADEGIDKRGGKLGACTLTDTLRLQAAVEHICSARADHGGMTPVVALRRRKRRPLMVTLMPADPVDPLASGVAVACVFDPEQDLTPIIEPACRVYGLSPSETRLTCRLADGGSLSEAATALGVREQTARSYLKQIFLKTETNRQSELVWLMLKSAVRITDRVRTQVF